MKQAKLWLAVVLVGAAGMAAGPAEWIEQAKRGELPEAKASWWGFDAADATGALQAAIDSGVQRLVVDNVGKPWIVRPIVLASNQTVVFAKGVVVEAKEGEFKGGTDSLFRIDLKENVELVGEDAILRMRRADYDNPALYKKAEWRHVLCIRSSKNVTVSGLTLALSGGDGIYLGVAKKGVTNENVTIRNVVCDRNYRQGISVISARHLLIENVVMKDTAGTPPAAGIDFEPNLPSEELVDCVMRNCVAESNQGCGYVLYLPNLHRDSAPISIRLENCVSRNGNRTDFAFITGNSEEEAVLGTMDVVNCRFEKAVGSAISIERKPATGAAVRFVDCVVDSPAAEESAVTPIIVRSKAGSRQSVGGIDFGEMTVIDAVERPAFGYEDWMGGSGVQSLRGTFHIQRNGQAETVALTQEWLAKTFPPRTHKQIPPLALAGKSLVPAAVAPELPVAKEDCFVRRGGTFVVYARQGETVTLRVKLGQVGRYSGKTMPVTAIAPSGAKIKVGEVPFPEEAELSFATPETGLYRLSLECSPNRVAVTGISHPVAISGEKGAISFIGAAGDLYFLVPAGTKDFGILVYGDSGEAIKATVFDPTGQQVWEKDTITLPVQFAPDRPAPTTDEVWHLRLSKPSALVCEDNCVDLRGIPPFLARDPKGLLKAE